MKGATKSIIIIGVIVALGAVAYFVFFNNNAAPDTGLQNSPGASTSASNALDAAAVSAAAQTTSQEFLALLLNVQSIRLDDKLFASPAFTLLQDFNQAIPSDNNPGRPNPFAPIGNDVSANTNQQVQAPSTPVVSQITTALPSGVSATSTNLNGILSAAAGTNVWFEYGATSALGTKTDQKTLSGPGTFSIPVSSLLPGTTYYVKASALTPDGQTLNGDMVTFNTPKAAAASH